MQEETKSFLLLKPIELDGRKFESVELSEPEAWQIEKATIAATVKITFDIMLIADVGRIPLAVAKKLGKRDLTRMASYLEGFTVDDPPTGASS